MKMHEEQEKKFPYERIFKIAKNNNTIDLTGSLSIVNNTASETYFESEIYEITFISSNKKEKGEYTMLVTANECISDVDIQRLQEKLQISIEGSGMNFTVRDYTKDFTIQFDKENSLFVNSSTIQNGCIYFSKEE